MGHSIFNQLAFDEESVTTGVVEVAPSWSIARSERPELVLADEPHEDTYEQAGDWELKHTIGVQQGTILNNLKMPLDGWKSSPGTTDIPHDDAAGNDWWLLYLLKQIFYGYKVNSVPAGEVTVGVPTANDTYETTFLNLPAEVEIGQIMLIQQSSIWYPVQLVSESGGDYTFWPAMPAGLNGGESCRLCMTLYEDPEISNNSVLHTSCRFLEDSRKNILLGGHLTDAVLNWPSKGIPTLEGAMKFMRYSSDATALSYTAYTNPLVPVTSALKFMLGTDTFSTYDLTNMSWSSMQKSWNHSLEMGLATNPVKDDTDADCADGFHQAGQRKPRYKQSMYHDDGTLHTAYKNQTQYSIAMQHGSTLGNIRGVFIPACTIDEQPQQLDEEGRTKLDMVWKPVAHALHSSMAGAATTDPHNRRVYYYYY